MFLYYICMKKIHIFLFSLVFYLRPPRQYNTKRRLKAFNGLIVMQFSITTAILFWHMKLTTIT